MLTLQANAAAIRRAVLNGKNYLVAPMTMLVPGVLNGSKGPLFYSEEDTAESVSHWNGMPITVEHPADDSGQYISARDPGVLNRQGIGMVLRAKFAGKLTSEGWFDEDRTKLVNPRIYNDLMAGRPIELSTGLYTENEDKVGHHNGRSYVGIARKYRPDHLAILPSGTGACSLSDGCGVLINRETFGLELVFNEKQTVVADGDDTSDVTQNRKGIEMKFDRKTMIEKLVGNCKCSKKEEVLELNKLTDDQLKLLGNAFPPERGTAEGEEEEDPEEDAADSGADEEAEGEGSDPKKKMACNKAAEEAKWLASAPAEMRRMVTNQRKLEKAEKAKSIKTIMESVNNSFSKETLEKMSVDDLRPIAKLAKPVVNQYLSDEGEEDEGANFTANGFSNGRVDNAASEVDQESIGLQIPEMDLSK